MPHDYKGITWYVKGVDSVATHRVDGTPINPLVWCRHDETGGDFEETRTHIVCTECGRTFQRVHPVTAERIVRERDSEIIRMQAMIGNA